MGSDLMQGVLAILGGIITLAIISVIVGKNSKAPQAISALGGFTAGIVNAAVSPVSTAQTNGNLGANTFTSPSFGPPTSWADIANYLGG